MNFRNKFILWVILSCLFVAGIKKVINTSLQSSTKVTRPQQILEFNWGTKKSENALENGTNNDFFLETLEKEEEIFKNLKQHISISNLLNSLCDDQRAEQDLLMNN